MKITTICKLGGWVVALAIGALAGSLRSSKPAEQHAPKTAIEAPALAPAAPVAPPESALSAVTEAAIKEITAATGARRWLLLLEAAEKATAGDMPGLIRSVRDDSTAIRMLAARWAELDPKHMFGSIYADSFAPEDSPGALPRRYELGAVLFEEWAKRDLAGAVKALTDAPAFSMRESYRMTVVSAAMKQDVEQGLRMMKEWNIRGYIPDMRKVTEWAARDPQRAAEVVLQLGNDSAGQEALREVGKAWAQTDPEGGLRFAAKLDARARGTLGAELMQAWAQR